MTLALLATLGAIVVGFVLFPVFTTAGSKLEPLSPRDRERLDLAEKKAQLYEAIQDLDFEKASGKLGEADYETARSDYLAQVAAVMAKLDELKPNPGAPEAPADAGQPGARRCAGCGTTSSATAKFCIECGEPLLRACASCGEPLGQNARFCSECGEKVPA